MKTLITKNPKSEGSFFGKSLILVKDVLNQEVCLFYTVKETTFNRFGGKNNWVITYCVYNPTRPQYEWVQNSGALRPWIGKQACDKHACFIESPLYGGTSQKYYLLNKEDMLLEEFTLRAISPQRALNLFQEWDRSFVHSWGGQYFYLLPSREGWKQYYSMEHMLSEKTAEEADSEDIVEEITKYEFPTEKPQRKRIPRKS